MADAEGSLQTMKSQAITADSPAAAKLKSAEDELSTARKVITDLESSKASLLSDKTLLESTIKTLQTAVKRCDELLALKEAEIEALKGNDVLAATSAIVKVKNNLPSFYSGKTVIFVNIASKWALDIGGGMYNLHRKMRTYYCARTEP